MKRALVVSVMTVAVSWTLAAQTKIFVAISAVAAAGSITDGRYTNSYFKLTVDAPNATLELNPVVNNKGQFARLLQIESKPTSWENTYALAVLADALAINPQVQSPLQWVRSVRHKLEQGGLPTVQEEFPITIAGEQFTGAILQPQVNDRKIYRGIFAAFRNDYVLTFDVEAASPDRVKKLVTELVKKVN